VFVRSEGPVGSIAIWWPFSGSGDVEPMEEAFPFGGVGGAGSAEIFIVCYAMV
jgi:hypothetical protein